MENKKAADVCTQFYLGDGAKKLLTPDLSAEEFVKLLTQKKEYVDAIRVLAYALPKQTAIKWASACAQHFAQSHGSDKSAAALEAVHKWLAEPSDENRREAKRAADEAEFTTPAGSTALAVFLSGGSAAPADKPAMEPHQTMMPSTIFGGVMLAVLSKEPEKAEEKYNAFIAEGLKLATQQS